MSKKNKKQRNVQKKKIGKSMRKEQTSKLKPRIENPQLKRKIVGGKTIIPTNRGKQEKLINYRKLEHKFIIIMEKQSIRRKKENRNFKVL